MFFPVFLSVVLVVRNQATAIESVLSRAVEVLTPIVSDYEIVVVDNASEDETIAVLKTLTREKGLPNVQVYALTKEVAEETASWVGLENALGDFIAVIDPFVDDIAFLPQMVDKAVGGMDVVFARNQQKMQQPLLYTWASSAFNRLYTLFCGVHLAKEAPHYRVLSRKIVNFLLQHPQPAITYRHLPATGGFAKTTLTYSATPTFSAPKRLAESIDKGMRLLVSTTHAPMRLVTSLSLFGAVANLVYSLYVVGVWLFKEDVAPGWVSLSLQQSGMFFLISLVLLVLGEYILHMATLSNEGPLYHIAQEFASARLTRCEKLNIEDAGRNT